MTFEKIDLNLWKEIQDSIAMSLGICVSTIDNTGKEVLCSGPKPLYCQLISQKKPEIQFKGLKTLELPVSLMGEEIGKVIALIGKEEYDSSLIADRLVLNKEEVEQAMQNIEEIDNDKIKLAKKLLGIFSETMPRIAYRQQTKEKKVRKLSILYNITRKLNSTIEMNETLSYVMQELVKALEAENCMITIDDKKYYLREGTGKYEEKIPLMTKGETIGMLSLYSEKQLEKEDQQFIGIIATEVAMAITNAQKYSEAKEIAIVDKLTGCYTKRHFSELVEKRICEKVDKENPVSIILVDIDDFGNYNNMHGHVKGDELLKELGKVLRNIVREKGIVGRYGGEEFIIMMPAVKPHEAIGKAGEIRETIENNLFYGREKQPNGKLTISLGLVICMAEIKSTEAIKEADSALYSAKSKGKNQVVHKVWLGKGLKAEV